MERQHLLTECEVLQNQVFTRTEAPSRPSQKITSKCNHGLKSYRIRHTPKSANQLILLGASILARHSNLHPLQPVPLLASGFPWAAHSMLG